MTLAGYEHVRHIKCSEGIDDEVISCRRQGIPVNVADVVVRDALTDDSDRIGLWRIVSLKLQASGGVVERPRVRFCTIFVDIPCAGEKWDSRRGNTRDPFKDSRGSIQHPNNEPYIAVEPVGLQGYKATVVGVKLTVEGGKG